MVVGESTAYAYVYGRYQGQWGLVVVAVETVVDVPVSGGTTLCAPLWSARFKSQKSSEDFRNQKSLSVGDEQWMSTFGLL
jgi:hypothetical protein